MALAHPETSALVQPSKDGGAHLVLNFSQFASHVAGATRQLQDQGISRGCRTLLMVQPGLELVVLVFSLFQVGAVPIVIDPGMGLRNFRACVKRTKPDALVGGGLAQAISILFFQTFRSVSIRACIRKNFLQVCAQRDEPVDLKPAHAKPEDLAAILFTSGSTGPPKGVCYEHRHFDAQVQILRDLYNIKPGEVDMPLLPVFALFNPALGMTTVVPPVNPSKPAKADPARIVRILQEFKVTNSFGSPVLWKLIGEHCETNEIQLPDLRRILMAGASVPPELLRQWIKIAPGAKIHTPYGATECLPVSSISAKRILSETCTKTEAGYGSCLGRAVPGISIRIQPPIGDSETTIQEDQEIGEIVVTGPVVTTAYDQLPEATERAKIREGDILWHRMGDLGYLDNERNLWFCGRVAERVVTPEGPLFTDFCEAVFNKHPRVFRSALIGLGQVGSQKPALVVQPETGHFPRDARKRAAFVEELSEIALSSPRTRTIETFFFHRDFPVDVRHNAKIHRLALARIFGSQTNV